MAPAEVARLTVSEIRQRIFEAAGTASQGAGSLAGMLFHRVASSALQPDHPASWRKAVGPDVNVDQWAEVLYEQVLGPELTRLQSTLAQNGQEVLTTWQATKAFAGWFCGLLQEAQQSGAVRFDPLREEWVGGDGLFQAECELTATLRDPAWARTVEVAGRADQLIQIDRERWCVVEFKLGGGHAEADAAQVCLYHELLGATGSAALVCFGGEGVEQTVFPAAAMQAARPKLMALIGAMMGVGTGAGTRAVAGAVTGSGAATVPSARAAWPRPAGEAELEMGTRLIRTLKEFNSDARLAAEPIVGPTFIRFLLEPGRGVPASRIEKQGADLQVRLQLAQEPMIGRANGRIAVDVQRPDRELVPFQSLEAALVLEKRAGGNAKVLAGIDLKGTVHLIDLSRDAAHLLVGGIPGGGKSEWLRSAVASLLLTNSPDTLRLVLIDPKKNAFVDLARSSYLWQKDSLVDSPEGRIIPLLETLVEEMQRRYELFKDQAADDLDHYARKTGSAPARLVCVVDEFADLLLGARKAERDEIERGFIRIAQLGRASGVHLLLATQRPSRQVVSGVLKANIPGKIALRVANRTESGVLLDQGGAQHLLGRGDLLMLAGGSEPVRLQSAYLSEEDRRRVFLGR